MKPSPTNVKQGSIIIYNDRQRPPAKAVVLDVNETSMQVSFEDRASINRIQFNDRAWMDHLEVFELKITDESSNCL